MKNINVGKNAGFCGGVELCTTKLEKLLTEHKKLYCIGEVVHNKKVVDYFKNKGLLIVDSLDKVPNNEKMIIRAHGTTLETYNLLKNKNIQIYDLTCPKVLNIRNIIKDYINNDTYIIYIGTKNHPETFSTISFCGDNSSIIENKEDIDNIIIKCKTFNNILIIGQTTFSLEKYINYSEIIKKKLSKDKNIIIKNTICNATKIRQKEVEELSKKNDCMIIIGGYNSSNTRKLYEISKQYCKNSYLIEDKEEIDIDKIKKYNNIGIMAGASTPKSSIEGLVNLLKSIKK